MYCSHYSYVNCYTLFILFICWTISLRKLMAVLRLVLLEREFDTSINDWNCIRIQGILDRQDLYSKKPVPQTCAYGRIVCCHINRIISQAPNVSLIHNSDDLLLTASSKQPSSSPNVIHTPPNEPSSV